ncbi:MAG: hypothetical protein LC122_15725 [Chitinophagales bacterium]|nr:hypothetical protein [Chitinophagales bacterium]
MNKHKLFDSLRSIQITHIGVLITQVLVFITLFIAQKIKNPQPKPEIRIIIHYVVISVTIISLITAFIYFSYLLKKLPNYKSNVEDYFKQYNIAYTRKSFILELSCFAVIMGYFLTAHIYYIIAFAILIILFVFQYPTNNTIKNHLELTDKDIMQ